MSNRPKVHRGPGPLSAAASWFDDGEGRPFTAPDDDPQRPLS